MFSNPAQAKDVAVRTLDERRVERLVPGPSDGEGAPGRQRVAQGVDRRARVEVDAGRVWVVVLKGSARRAEFGGHGECEGGGRNPRWGGREGAEREEQ